LSPFFPLIPIFRPQPRLRRLLTRTECFPCSGWIIPSFLGPAVAFHMSNILLSSISPTCRSFGFFPGTRPAARRSNRSFVVTVSFDNVLFFDRTEEVGFGGGAHFFFLHLFFLRLLGVPFGSVTRYGTGFCLGVPLLTKKQTVEGRTGRFFRVRHSIFRRRGSILSFGL